MNYAFPPTKAAGLTIEIRSIARESLRTAPALTSVGCPAKDHRDPSSAERARKCIGEIMRFLLLRRIGRFALLLVATLLVLAPPMACAEGGSLADATRLVKAMEIDRAAVLAALVAIRGGPRDDPLSQRVHACVAWTDPSVFTGYIATLLAKDMSAEEMKQATLFFEGTAGKKLVRKGEMVDLQPWLDAPQAGPIEELTKEEMAEWDKFSKTSAWEKAKEIGIRSTADIRGSLAKIDEVVQKCMEQARPIGTDAKQRSGQ